MTSYTESFLNVIDEKGDNATFADIFYSIWLPRKQSTIASWKTEAQRIENILIPAIGHIPIKELTPRTVMSALAPYEDRLPTLERLCMRVNEIINFAMCADLVEYNSCSKLRICYPHHKSEHMPYITHKELPEFFYVMTTNDGKRPLRPCIKLYFIYHLYSMGRASEVANLKWEYIKDDIITIPAEKMKGRRPHRIWLCPGMVELLKAIYCLSTYHNEYVFPFGNNHEPISSQYLNKWIWSSSLKGRTTAHGLRSTARTWLRDVGCPNEVGEDFLSHVYGTPTERSYIRSDYLEQRKPYYQKWFNYLRSSYFLSQMMDREYVGNRGRDSMNQLLGG